MARSMVRSRGRLRRRNLRTGGFLGIERKFYDTEVSNTTVAAGGPAGAELDPPTVNCLSAPAQGDGESQRDGRKIVIKGVFLKGFLEMANNTSAAERAGPVRIAVVLDTQTNGSQLSAEHVYKNPTSAYLDACEFRNLQYSSRFKILTDKVINPGPVQAYYDADSGTHTGMSKLWSINLPNLDIPVTFTSSSEGVASVADNSLHVIAMKSANGGSIKCSYNARLRFVG